MPTQTLKRTHADAPGGSSRLARRGLLAAAGLTALGLARAQGQTSVAPGDDRAPALPRLGQNLPIVDVPLLDGTLLRAADLQGKVLVVYWWASWCPFCAEQSPHVEALWRRERARGLQVLALSIDKTAAAADPKGGGDLAPGMSAQCRVDGLE